MRIFLDANILFSAAKSDGATRQLLRHLLDRGDILCVNPFVEIEALRNLQSRGGSALIALERLLRKLTMLPLADAMIAPTLIDWLPEKDRPVLAAAIDSRCDILLTGDKRHFGKGFGRSFGGVRVDFPASLFEVLPPA